MEAGQGVNVNCTWPELCPLLLLRPTQTFAGRSLRGAERMRIDSESWKQEGSS